jgi:hypothetical protein
VALTKRADPAELKAIFLKVSIKESICFLFGLCSITLEDYFKQLFISLLKNLKTYPKVS